MMLKVKNAKKMPHIHSSKASLLLHYTICPFPLIMRLDYKTKAATMATMKPKYVALGCCNTLAREVVPQHLRS